MIEGLVAKGFVPERVDWEALPRLQQLRHHVGRGEFDARYLRTMLETCRLCDCNDVLRAGGATETLKRTFLWVSRAEAAQLGHREPYRPTIQELEMVLAHYAQHPELTDREARVQAIKAAIAAPRWTQEWPQRDGTTRGSSEQEPESDSAKITEDFLRELESLDDTESRVPPLNPKVTQRSIPMDLGEVLAAAGRPGPEAVLAVRCLGYDHHYFSVVGADSSITAFTAPYPETIFLNLDLAVDWDVLLLAAVPLASHQALEQCRDLLAKTRVKAEKAV